MKLLLILSFLSFGAMAQDKSYHRTVTQKIDSYEISRKSITPNKAVVYISYRDSVDLVDVAETTIDSHDVSDGQLIIQRAALPFIYGRVTSTQSLSRCQADYGTAEVTSTQIIVSTRTLPIIVRCENADGSYRETYHTFQQ